MKPPDEIRRALVEQWLKKAEEDYGVAEFLPETNEPLPQQSLAGAPEALEEAADKVPAEKEAAEKVPAEAVEELSNDPDEALPE